MAYAAVISLKQTIYGLLNPAHFSIASAAREILESAFMDAASLQEALEKLNDSGGRCSGGRLDAMEAQIRDCAYELEDVLESHESNQFESHTLSLDLEGVRKEITSFAETVKKIELECVEELSKPAIELVDDEAAASSSDVGFGVEMVGYSSDLVQLRHLLVRPMRPDDAWFYALRGEVGSGRTFVARKVFEDLRRSERRRFDCYAWVAVGKKYDLKEVAMRILAQVDSLGGDYEMLISRGDEKICRYLCKILESRRYMIVLDDVHDVQVLDYFRRSLPDQSNGSIVILTTGLDEVAQLCDTMDTFDAPAHYFQEAMWLLVRASMFGTELISQELEEAGKKIAENCRALLISMSKVTLFLHRTEKSLEQWSRIAADKKHPIFMIGDEISEVCKLKAEFQSYNWDMHDLREGIIVGIISSCLDSYKNVVAVSKMKMHPETERFFSRMQIISLLGMAGIGKSTFARKIFKDKSILSHFNHLVWIIIGPKYQAQEVLIDILAQIYPGIDKLHMKGDEILVKDLCADLSDKRCLIVLDDLRSEEPLHHLKNLFPDIKGTILMTTRLAKVAKFGRNNICYEMRLLDKEESWCLLRQKVFAGRFCSMELEEVGRRIAEKCEGLPLLILTVGDQLLKLEVSHECWDNVASGKQKSVFMNAHHKISKSLLPSYKSLPEHLKPCFLYMGAFRNSYEIPISKLTNLWIAERFLEPHWSQFEECMSELVDRSLVMAQRKVLDLKFRTCHLHTVFWHLSNTIAGKNNFFHAMNSDADCSIESIKSQRRLCIRNNILLGFKDVQNSMASIKSAHSLLCVSPLQQYPVPISFDFRLLRVMDALTVRLYEFPIEIVKLVHLRYLSLTCNAKLPTSISNFRKLQFLIVRRYMNIKSSENYSHLPAEIWDMKELRHLEVMGGCLPNPKYGAGLPKLSTLLDVSAQSCRKKVLRRIPNLKKLGIRIELAPDDEVNPFGCLNNISCLRVLESLKCVVINPQIGTDVAHPPSPISMFPSSLKKLSLSGLGFPWEHMSIIGKLKNLEVLKLKHFAFRGPKWEMEGFSPFRSLKSLSIEDTDLVHWVVNSPISTKLECLSIKHCYKLVEFPVTLPFCRLRNIEIVDCSTSTWVWAAEMGKMRRPDCEVKVQVSAISPVFLHF